ncbi:MAG: M3 family oligoendopeptidase [candidate division Zixibacteria bacterium]|nr:M3 family oligoendopeptidase [candidate division Zixibacteria bacterium]
MCAQNKIPPAPRWDLESIFPGGSKSTEFKAFREKTAKGLEAVKAGVKALPKTLDDSTAPAWTKLILLMQDVAENIHLCISFPHMLVSQDVSDDLAHAAEAEGMSQWSTWEQQKTELNSLSLLASDEAWNKLMNSTELSPIKFALDRDRNLAKMKMPAEQESLMLELATDGYHAWNRLYDKMAGDLRVQFEENGETTEISLGQLATKMADSDRSIRAQAFAKLTEAWKSRADLAAMALNSQAGFRLAVYGRRGWKSPLFEPLHQSRLTQESLDAMWGAISRETPQLGRYVDAKKKLLGIDRFSWYDEFAPCGQVERLYPFDEAGDFIVKNVGEFSTEMADFMRMALDKRWVEAEDRSGKAGGGYCTRTGPFRESRIFMTYGGSYDNLLTLAHELGHAYHGFVLKEKPYFASHYPMTLAETASIFSELLTTDAALKVCDDPQEKLMLLDQKIQQPLVFFTDIHTRYLFDKSFYAERAKGVVGKDRLCELMIAAQKEAFGNLLDESGYHPYFWASKLHFFITDTPFYNYPYTFGYLFAGGVYDRAKKEGSSFAEKYRALLADTGCMTSEEVAMKHLGVDLTKADFWRDAVARSLSDIDEFVKLAESK